MLVGFPSEAIEFLTDFRCGICSKKFKTYQLLIGRPGEKKVMAVGLWTPTFRQTIPSCIKMDLNKRAPVANVVNTVWTFFGFICSLCKKKASYTASEFY